MAECDGSGDLVPQLDPDSLIMKNRTDSDAYCWKCDMYRPIGPPFKDPKAGWVAVLLPHERKVEESNP